MPPPIKTMSYRSPLRAVAPTQCPLCCCCCIAVTAVPRATCPSAALPQVYTANPVFGVEYRPEAYMPGVGGLSIAPS